MEPIDPSVSEVESSRSELEKNTVDPNLPLSPEVLERIEKELEESIAFEANPAIGYTLGLRATPDDDELEIDLDSFTEIEMDILQTYGSILGGKYGSFRNSEIRDRIVESRRNRSWFEQFGLG